MLINLTNHPSSTWSKEQLITAERLYGSIIDIPFPSVDPNGNEDYITKLADDYCQRVQNTLSGDSITVHIMGEMTLTFAIVNKLQKNGITCIASTTKRCSMEQPDGRTLSVFRFVKFRRYSLI